MLLHSHGIRGPVETPGEHFSSRVGLLPAFLLGAILLVPALAAQDWPQFLGPTRDGTYREDNLAASWPASGPEVRWQKNIGQGFSAPVVAGGKLILFHRPGDKEVVDCFDAESGKAIWSRDYPTAYVDDFGFDEGPRATPVVAGGRVFTFGAEGTLSAFELESGAPAWSVKVHDKLRVKKGFFGAACSPLVEGNNIIVNAGGAEQGGIVAFEAATGKLAWKATDHEASYSSPVGATIGGKRHVFCLTREGLVDLDPGAGEVRFSFHWRSRSRSSVNAATPLVAGDLVFISASYETGAALLSVKEKEPEVVWSSDEALSCHYSTPVLREGVLYGFHGRQEYGQSLRAVDLKSGKVLWTKEALGAGTVTLARDRLLILTEKGELILAPASPEGFEPAARAGILKGEVRAYPALAAGRLYARSKDTLVCVDLRAPGK